MTHNHLYRPDINLGYDETGCTAMTEGMSDDPFDFSRFESGKIDPLVKILCIDMGGLVMWREAPRAHEGHLHMDRLQYLNGFIGKRDMARVPMFGARDGQDLVLQIDI